MQKAHPCVLGSVPWHVRITTFFCSQPFCSDERGPSSFNSNTVSWAGQDACQNPVAQHFSTYPRLCNGHFQTPLKSSLLNKSSDTSTKTCHCGSKQGNEKDMASALNISCVTVYTKQCSVAKNYDNIYTQTIIFCLQEMQAFFFSHLGNITFIKVFT